MPRPFRIRPVTPSIKRWQPGAWTPARCALWWEMGQDGRKRLERWVMAEYERGRCHAVEVPEIAKETAA